MKSYSSDELTLMIRESGLRVTDHRLAIVALLSKTKLPITVYEIVDVLRKKEDIDQATVYRNLTSLQEAGLVRRLDFNHGHAHYELENGRASHQLVCTKCETFEKIEGVAAGETIKKMMRKSKKFKLIPSNSIEIYGLCRNCA
jgi:Fur family ferric uptake transcriptional regulator